MSRLPTPEGEVHRRTATAHSSGASIPATAASALNGALTTLSVSLRSWLNPIASRARALIWASSCSLRAV